MRKYELFNPKKHDNDLVKNKKSRYNKNKLVNICEVCKQSNATETHHINYKKERKKLGWNGNSVLLWFVGWNAPILLWFYFKTCSRKALLLFIFALLT